MTAINVIKVMARARSIMRPTASGFNWCCDFSSVDSSRQQPARDSHTWKIYHFAVVHISS